MRHFALAAIAALAVGGLAFAQTQPIPGAKTASGQPAPVTGAAIVVAPAGGGAGLGTVVAPDHPLPVTCISGCSGGGGGGSTTVTATAAAPSYVEGSDSNPLSTNLTADLRVIAKIASGQSVGISGTLPAFAATPTFNCGTGCGGAGTAQGAAIGGLTGGLNFGSVTTAAPSYTNATANSLSLTTAGALRVDGSGVTQPVSGTITANLGTIAGVATAALQSNVQGTFGGTVANRSVMYDATGVAVDWTDDVPVINGATPFSVTVGGTLPAFAATPAFTISGTLPAFAATPTVNLGTIGGAATAAKQPALGTAGTPSADVITVQGNASGTPLPVSGTVSVGSVVGGGPVSNGTAQAGSLLMGGVFNTTKPTLSNGQQSAIQTTNRGELFVVPLTAVGNQFTTTAPADAATGVTGLNTWSQTALRGATQWQQARDILGSFGAGTGVAAVEQAGSTFQYISGAQTVQVKTGAGILHKVTVGTCVTGATVDLIDNTSGTTVNIQRITCPATVGNPFTVEYDLGFTTGLRVITSGATDVNVSYR